MKAEFVDGSGLGDDESVSIKYAIKRNLSPFLE
jgi:hypothetical protein